MIHLSVIVLIAMLVIPVGGYLLSKFIRNNSPMPIRIFFIDADERRFKRAKYAFDLISRGCDLNFFPTDIRHFRKMKQMIIDLIDSNDKDEIRMHYSKIKNHLDKLQVNAFIIDFRFLDQSIKKKKLADDYGLNLASFLEWGHKVYGLDPLRGSKSKLFVLTSHPSDLPGFKETWNRLYMNRVTSNTEDIDYVNIFERIRDRLPDLVS